MNSFFIINKYTFPNISDSDAAIQVFGPEGGCVLDIDSSNIGIQRVMIISSDFPNFTAGLIDSSERAGSVYTLMAWPDSQLNGSNNYLSIYYSDGDLRTHSEAYLRIYRWLESTSDWQLIGGEVDTLLNRVYSQISEFGTYAAFPTELGPSGCPYSPGDINGNGAVNGVDIVYGVNYLKGTGPHPPTDCGGICPEPPPFYAAGDVNGNCAFNGIDITFFVRYLKGQVPALLYCVDCPPAGMNPPAPAVELIREQILKRQSKNTEQ